ncbi:hypothetical protein BKG75_24015 [Mycobacteroides chelonae]|nr:hypothetical protein DYE20_05235 [[Mycobacterium] chelonae subsp. gwanakae]OHU12542.1 hypothetical protein BKG75_24015 [Mycobacteroides chelonae]
MPSSTSASASQFCKLASLTPGSAATCVNGAMTLTGHTHHVPAELIWIRLRHARHPLRQHRPALHNQMSPSVQQTQYLE